jgi:hypothetical protein
MSSLDSSKRDLVALVLAIGLSLAILLLMTGVLWDALRSDTPGISENSTQIISTSFGGIIGILGSYLGYKAGSKEGDSTHDESSARARDHVGDDQ